MSELHCPKATRLLSDAEDRELSPHERESLRTHLTICPACVRFAEQLRLIRTFIRRWRESA
jgi:hypothetical protein